jgi:hypothetical protein
MIFYWFLFLPPAFLLYTASAIAVAFFLILYCAPRYGQTNIFIYIGICSIIGSLTVSEISSPFSNSLAHSSRWQNSTVVVIFWFTLLNWSNILSQVMSVKAIGIAIKLTLDGANQFVYFQTWIFTMVAVSCIITSLNYLNMVSITLSIFMWIYSLAWSVFNCVSSAF